MSRHPTTHAEAVPLERGATVAVIGGGPAGAFFALHLLRRARELGREVEVVIFERRARAQPDRAGAFPAPGRAELQAPVAAGTPLSSGPAGPPCWQGCNHCAGGISPRLNDVLNDLGLQLPPPVIQARIRRLTIQGYWKNIELEVPPGRAMFSVYRGSRPARRPDRDQSFDAFLLGRARAAGARVIGEEVVGVARAEQGALRVEYGGGAGRQALAAGFVVFAAGIKETTGLSRSTKPMLRALQGLIPGFVPPAVRRALVFELEGEQGIPATLAEGVHFVEYGSRTLRLEMCSLVPKRGFVTAVLVGPSIDALRGPGEEVTVIQEFLALPQIRKLVPPGARFRTVCMCDPHLVTGAARCPFGDRVAAVGDVATARLYKDGILSAEQTARALARTMLEVGVDRRSLRRGYGPTLVGFQRDNRWAAVVFAVHRLFFSSSILSRVLYQAVITERKSRWRPQRGLEQILWKIASGDDRYGEILLSMIHPVTVWRVLSGGLLVTARNFATELVFGLRWEGFGRFTTGVARERLEAKRLAFARLITESRIAVPARLEFERMYTIKVQAPPAKVLEQLGRFGEADRRYLRPRWVRIRRVAGVPQLPGCRIRYEVVHPRCCFSLELERVVGERLAVYRVQDGFARGGVLIFEIEPFAEGICTLSIYVAFNFARGTRWWARPFWWCFRHLFPAFIHDVLWNHSLCQLKDLVESQLREDVPEASATAGPAPQHNSSGPGPASPA